MHWFLKLIFLIFCLVIVYGFVIFSIPKILPTQEIKNTSVSGLVFQNQVWEGNIRIDGDLWFAKGTTVTVRPGTQIVVNKDSDRFNMDLLPWHIKYGINTGPKYNGVNTGEPFWDEQQKIQMHFATLNILGTKEQPVVLRSTSDPGSPYDFNSITADGGIISFLKASNYRRLEVGGDFVVRDSQFNNIGECAVCIVSGKGAIINNTFSQALREYIWVKGASPRITDNSFMKSTGAGIRVDPNRIGTPIILHNSFEMPDSLAIEILTGGELEGGVISNNTFSGNSKLKLTCDSKIQLIQNSIFGLVQFTQPGCANSYTFGPNYWGTDNKDTVLSDKVINSVSDFTVEIPMILKTPPNQVGRRI